VVTNRVISRRRVEFTEQSHQTARKGKAGEMFQQKLFDTAIGNAAAHRPGVDRQRVTFDLGRNYRNKATVAEATLRRECRRCTTGVAWAGRMSRPAAGL
jgi:hypothetical protein